MGKLNDLPDHILEHILSYVDDVESLVRTSLISRRWRTLWKHAPLPSVLKLSATLLRSCTVKRYRDSVRDLLTSLFSRPRRSALEINLEYFREEGDHYNTFVRVLALCARCDQPPESLSISHPGARLDNVYNFDTPLASFLIRAPEYRAIKESLRTLKLERTKILIDEHLDLSLLTRLELVECRIFVYQGLHAFARLTSLQHLKLIDCLSEYSLPLEVTSVPQLLSLEVRMLEPEIKRFPKELKERRSLGRLQLAQVSAPRLQTLRFCGRARDLSSVLLGELSFPCLEHAAVRLILVDPVDQLGVLSSAFRDVLLPSLHNAKSLHLCFEVAKNQEELKQWKQLHFPLIALKLLIKSQGSPLTKLKALRIQRQEPVPDSHVLTVHQAIQ